MKTDPGFKTDLRINPGLHPDFYRITPEMFFIHILLSSVISPSVVKVGQWLYEKR